MIAPEYRFQPEISKPVTCIRKELPRRLSRVKFATTRQIYPYLPTMKGIFSLDSESAINEASRSEETLLDRQ